METALFNVSDLKEWAYCPRIFYYQACLPRVRPTTHSMEAGTAAGRAEEGREERRSLARYGLSSGKREFNVLVNDLALGLSGEIDMVITTLEDGHKNEVIPVDYKLSERAAPNYKMQVAAYGLLLEKMRGVTVKRGFVYLIEPKRAVEVQIDARLRKSTLAVISAMHHTAQTDAMPDPTKDIGKCISCEFRRFCNDIL
jgi:CRISPR-associated exonuclease Cas4